MRDVFARVDPGALTSAGFARLTALTPPMVGPLGPDGIPEREQRRAHQAVTRGPDQRRRRRASAVDGTCLRGAVRTDGSRVSVLTGVRHDDALTAALREIGAKTNEIPEFAPLLDSIDDQDLNDALATVDAPHAQKGHARYLVEDRKAHYLLSVKSNQPTWHGS